MSEVADRPVGGVTTADPEEPYVNSTSTVPWEVPSVTGAPTRFEIVAATQSGQAFLSS